MGEAQGEAWSAVSTVMAGICVCGGIGYGLDRLFGTQPVLLVVGILLGKFLGIYLVYKKYLPATPEADRRVERGVAGWPARTPVPLDTTHPTPRAGDLVDLAELTNSRRADRPGASHAP